MLLPIVGPVKSVPGPKFSFRKILYFLNLLICLDSLGFLLQTFLDLSFGKLLLTSYCARGTTSGAVSPTDVGIYRPCQWSQHPRSGIQKLDSYSSRPSMILSSLHVPFACWRTSCHLMQLQMPVVPETLLRRRAQCQKSALSCAYQLVSL